MRKWSWAAGWRAMRMEKNEISAPSGAEAQEARELIRRIARVRVPVGIAS